MVSVPAVQRRNAGVQTRGPDPNALNCRGLLKWTPDQYVLVVQVGDTVVEAIGDTGGSKSLIDVELAKQMGLHMLEAPNGEFGTYYGPGGEEKAYYGKVPGPLTIRFSA